MRKKLRNTLVSVVAMASLVLSLSTPVAAQTSANVSVFATGLNNPRGIKLGPDGNLYVAEAGLGGDTPSNGTCEGYTSPFVPYMTGMTSRVSKVAMDGTRTTVVDGLPSGQDNTGAYFGLADVAFIDDTLYLLLMVGGCARGFEDFPASVLRVKADGSWEQVADLSAYFAANPTAAPNDDDWEPDGSVYNMIAVDGKLYVAEANHDELFEVTTDGKIRRIVDFSASEGHITPTAVAYHDGSFYVGNLHNFPIVAGAASIYQVSPEGQFSVFARGLTAVLGVAFDDQGRLYALETSGPSEFGAPNTGRVVRVGADGALTVMADGLNFPTAMTFGADGALYVSGCGYGCAAGEGQVLRIELANAP